MLRKGLLIWVWALVLLLLPGWEGRAEPARYRVTANYVNIREGKGWKEFHSFRTIKAAAEFCSTIPAKQ